jgi:hypothetical protein
MSAHSASRIALTLLVGSFLIPLSTSTMRGLHQLVTCTDELDQTFSVTNVDDVRAVITGSTAIVREPPVGSCAAVEMNMQVKPDGRGFILIKLPVENRSDRTWNSSVILRLDGLRTTVRIGQIPPASTRTKEIRVRLTNELRNITGTLVVGP